MYKLFCRNLANYFNINSIGAPSDDFRLRIASPLVAMTDISVYKSLHATDPSLYKEINNLIYEINKNIDRFHSFKAFSWELWGYGFDMEASADYSRDIIEEQLKLIDLLLSCHYWTAA